MMIDDGHALAANHSAMCDWPRVSLAAASAVFYSGEKYDREYRVNSVSRHASAHQNNVVGFVQQRFFKFHLRVVEPRFVFDQRIIGNRQFLCVDVCLFHLGNRGFDRDDLGDAVIQQRKWNRFFDKFNDQFDVNSSGVDHTRDDFLVLILIVIHNHR